MPMHAMIFLQNCNNFRMSGNYELISHSFLIEWNLIISILLAKGNRGEEFRYEEVIIGQKRHFEHALFTMSNNLTTWMFTEDTGISNA